MTSIDLHDQRERLVEILQKEGIVDSRVLNAIRRVPREKFVPTNMKKSAYHNSPLSIGCGQTISQPLIVAVMAEALRIQPHHRLLEIGTGLGYAAAVLAELAQEVFTVERHSTLATSAAERLRESNYDHVHVRHGDGTQGWAEHGPYDGISVAAASPSVPPALLNQLRIGGRLLIPYKITFENQQLLCLTRVDEDKFERMSLGSVLFVPLVGE